MVSLLETTMTIYTPLDETLRAWDDLVSQGKVRWELADYEGSGIAEHKNFVVMVNIQPRYSLLFRMIEEELEHMCLSGVFNAGKLYRERYWQTLIFSAIDRYRIWCSDRDCDLTTTTIRWAMEQLPCRAALKIVKVCPT